MTRTYHNALKTLARLHGISPRYRDGTGMVHEVPSESLCALLQAMQVPASTMEEVRQALRAIRLRPWTTLIDDVLVFRLNEHPWTWRMSLPLGNLSMDSLTVTFSLEDEQGQTSTFHLPGSRLASDAERMIGRTRFVRLRLPFPDHLTMGYYRLRVSIALPTQSLQGEAFVIVAPKQCYVFDQPARAWGLTAQLYGLRSSYNWGIGDFRDLLDLMKWAGTELGAATVGINPLHALPSNVISPYSPSSRLFYNPIYLNVEAIEEFQRSDAWRKHCEGASFQSTLHALRSHPLVDYPQVLALKLGVLERLFDVFHRESLETHAERAEAFRRFLEDEGVPLQRFAVFQVLQEQHPGLPWQQWPRELQNPASPAVSDLSQRYQERILFHQYVQWQCALQLRQVQRVAQQSGLSLGLYYDLAVGIHPEGADAWMFQDQLAQGVAIGAPPDSFNLGGQNWALQPPLPQRLRQAGYAFFRETLRRNMQHHGLLRIDHALGLFRLYWVPDGRSNQEGAYVQYPTEELLAVLALESVRQRVMIIGEDLGTATPAMRKQLAQAGLLSYRLLMFEKLPRSGYRRPKRLPTQALAAVSTHDLPTLRGFWVGRDIEAKEQAGLYPSPARADQDRAGRCEEREALLQALKKEKLLPEGISSQADHVSMLSDALCRAMYAYLARSSCRVVATSLEDLLGELDTPNLPGASEAHYPVWQRKLSRPFEEWRHDEAVLALAQAVHRERTASSNRADPD